MRLILVRHGLSMGNVDPTLYIEKGDQNISLTDTGWMQALEAGKFLKKYYGLTQTSKWPHIFLSPYLRTRQTLRGLLTGLEGFQKNPPKIREDIRLVEKFFGAASALEFLEHKDINPEVTKTLQTLFKTVYKGDPYTTKGLFGDSSKDTFLNVKNFMDGTLDRDFKQGHDDFLIVTHGAVIQAFLMAWKHLRLEDKAKIGNPNNCDLICIEGSAKNWTVTKLYDGEEMIEMNMPLLENLTPFSVADLPEFPKHLAP